MNNGQCTYVRTYVRRQLDLSPNYSNIISCFHFVLTYVQYVCTYCTVWCTLSQVLTHTACTCVCVYVQYVLTTRNVCTYTYAVSVSGEPCLSLLQGFECMVDLLNLQSEREDDPSAARALLDASKSLTRASLNVIEGAKVCGW